MARRVEVVVEPLPGIGRWVEGCGGVAVGMEDAREGGSRWRGDPQHAGHRADGVGVGVERTEPADLVLVPSRTGCPQ
jgi:hypothetical protein